jgi:hypothetical protein
MSASWKYAATFSFHLLDGRVRTGGVQDALHESANTFLRRKLRFAEVFARHR